MRALTVLPGRAKSAAVETVPEPAASDGTVLVRTLAIGVCGTDLEIVSGAYGWPPPGRERLVIGHESLGRVEAAPAGSGLAPGDLVAGIVRRPDPVPCANCAVGEWDMCRNGRYTERGIKERDGFASEHFRIEPEFAVKLDPKLGANGVLLEPTSVVAKAWDHIERIGRRAQWQPKSVLVTGAGPIGLLAALLGRQRGLEVHLLDVVETGPKPRLAKALGAEYHTKGAKDLGFVPDIVIECTGVAGVLVDVLDAAAPDGIVCLAGVSSGGHQLPIDLGLVNRDLVLRNTVVFGSVNANRRHYEAAAEALRLADPGWLAGLVTRRVPLERWADALVRRPDDVKVALAFGDA
jgi:threonine dehydrogenase-like Zn-dependent dehydrogenase